MHLDLAEVEYLLALINLPWSFKIIYGFMSDNLKIFNTKRKGHMILNISCCILAISAILIYHPREMPYFLTTCLFISQVNIAYVDTIIDALIVQNSKKSTSSGTENLNSLAFLMQATGAIAGALMAQMFTTLNFVNPFQAFGVYLLLQVILLVATLQLNEEESETGNIENPFDYPDHLS